MRLREGKSAFNLVGYRALCDYFNGHQSPWMEGIFCQLFTKLSVNTIGRSDNIDDLLLSNLDWENDALTICFGSSFITLKLVATKLIGRLFYRQH